MTRGAVEYAERKAMELFDAWNEVVGMFTPGTGYYGEIEACILDAVHAGIQMALYGKIDILDGNVMRSVPRAKLSVEVQEGYEPIEDGGTT